MSESTPLIAADATAAGSLLRVGITSTFEIAAEHHLPYHTGKCRRRHGHNYRLEFTRYGAVKDDMTAASDAGMVADFGDFDAQIKSVLAWLDHYSLNDDAGLPNPTAERLALWLLERLPAVDRVVVWETGRHCAHAERMAERLSERTPPPRRRRASSSSSSTKSTRSPRV